MFKSQEYFAASPNLENLIFCVFPGIWIHIQGENTPAFNADGYITGPDNTGTLISDLTKFLSVAQQNNLFVIPVLWSGAVLGSQRFINLIWDDSKLDSYINNALIVRKSRKHLE